MENLMNDLSRIKDNKDILEFKLLSDEGDKDKECKTFYLRLKLPMMSDRDCITKFEKTYE